MGKEKKKKQVISQNIVTEKMELLLFKSEKLEEIEKKKKELEKEISNLKQDALLFEKEGYFLPENIQVETKEKTSPGFRWKTIAATMSKVMTEEQKIKFRNLKSYPCEKGDINDLTEFATYWWQQFQETKPVKVVKIK